MEERLDRKVGLIFIGFGFGIASFVHASAPVQIIPDSPAVSINGLNYAVNTFVYSPKSLQWQAIQDGKVIRIGKGSGGSNYCRDIKRSCRTPSGTYSIISKGGPGCRSSRYPFGRGGAPMPYCMFFSKYYAIHGSPDLPNYNASHGCIRVRPSDAHWLSKNFIHVGSKVIVKSY